MKVFKLPRGIITLTLGLVFLSTSAMAAKDVKEVKIGVILPLSGSLAKIGENIKDGLTFAADEVNADGGIKSLNRAKLRLIFADSQGKPEIGQTAAEQLIHKEGVSILLGCFQSSVTLPATAVAERYKVPFLVQSSVMVDITKRGFKYTFRANQPATVDAKTEVDFLEAVGKTTGMRAKTIALAYENSEWGQNHNELLKQYLKEAGFQVVFEESYAAHASDLTPLVLKIKKAKPDVLMLTPYLADAILLTKTIAKLKLDVMAVITPGGGQTDPSYLPSVGKLADYQFSAAEWHIGLLGSKPWAKPINDAFKARFGIDLSAFSAQAYSNIYIIKDVLERAASTDREKIRKAFTETNITGGRALIMPYKKIQFDKDGQNPYCNMVMLQALNGKYHVVFPFEVAEPNYQLVWPTPKWSER